MTVEELLRRSGDFGPAQLWLLSLFCAVNLLSSFHYFAQTFISLNLKTCGSQHIDYNVTNNGVNNTLGVIFPEMDVKFHSLSNEMGWTCEEGWKMALVQSTYFIGSVLGTLVLGILADSLGRLPMLFTANVFAITGNIMTVYLPANLWSLSLSRFIAGVAVDTNFFMMYIIVMEYIKPSFRTFGLNFCIGVWYCVGCMTVPWLAVYTQHWRLFLVVISIPMVIIPISTFFMPESAQWLLSRGKTEDAIRCFKKIATINKKELSTDFIEQFKATVSTQNAEIKNGDLIGLFRTPRLRRKTCILVFKTMVLTLCYDAMSRNINSIDMDPFLLFTITSSSIFPSCLVILIFQDRIGRKAMAVFSLLLTGVFNLVQGIILLYQKDLSPTALAAAGLLARFAVNIAYNSGTQYAAELIPTQVRGQGLATIHVIGYGAAFFSPHILYLSNKWISTPETILAILSIAGAAFCIFLPETLNKSLPTTLEDGELFGEDENPWDFLKRKKAADTEKTGNP
ncbi:UNVERIFIED_CONTAM: hypothetical protein PYX00_003482 [Menopon gallinae]|uniref:Major facilitator superfamily (MFS) profile domain-containing protein n=1 Tax=Menopon gallinae TaxID=328185 RepID=A0AAW2I175_9NEOP